MAHETAARVLVLGVGNAERGADAAGPLTAQRLFAARDPAVEVRTLAGEAAELIDAWTGRRAVVVIDAVVTGASPGTLHRWDAVHDAPDVPLRETSSHGFGLGQAIELARALGRLPPVLIVYGIEGARFDLGEPPGAAILAAVERAAAAVRREARRLTASR